MRQALNVAYAMLVDGLDSEQRAQLDADLHGWTESDKAALGRLLGPGDEGGG